MKIIKCSYDSYYDIAGDKKIRKCDVLVEAQCEVCGKSVVRKSRWSKNAKSCGCIPRNLEHGLSGGGDPKKMHPIYKLWIGIRYRCKNKNSPGWKHYGGKGITVCEEWNSFQNFFNWSMSNGYRKGLYIDRINNSEGYKPDNCRFVTPAESARNRSTTKLDIEKVRMIRSLSLSGWKDGAIAKAMAIKKQTVRDVRAGDRWKNVI